MESPGSLTPVPAVENSGHFTRFPTVESSLSPALHWRALYPRPCSGELWTFYPFPYSGELFIPGPAVENSGHFTLFPTAESSLSLALQWRDLYPRPCSRKIFIHCPCKGELWPPYPCPYRGELRAPYPCPCRGKLFNLSLQGNLYCRFNVLPTIVSKRILSEKKQEKKKKREREREKSVNFKTCV